MTAASLTFCSLLRQLRRERGLSQLALAINAGASARHLSFLETGRARPSEAMVSRLAKALNLGPARSDDLRTAAGFCTRDTRRWRGIGDRTFESALAMDDATTPAEVVAVARPLLRELGIVQFFFGTLHDDPKPQFEWADFGAFPSSWLHRYDRERYALTDPLLAVVRTRRESFFWDDVIDRHALKRPAREMFARAAARYLGRIRCVATMPGIDATRINDGRARRRSQPGRAAGVGDRGNANAGRSGSAQRAFAGCRARGITSGVMDRSCSACQSAA